MKNSIKSIMALALAALFTLTALPFGIAAHDTSPTWSVPSGYNASEYEKVATFLEQTDENGVRNGDKLSLNYDPDHPDTWGECFDPDYYMDVPTFQWDEFEGELHVFRVCINEKELVGALDLSDFPALYYVNCASNALSALKVDGCGALRTLDCSGNRLAALELSTNPALYDLNCNSNRLSTLNLSANAALNGLKCAENMLSSLDVSSNTELESIVCSQNGLSVIDVSMLQKLSTLDISYNELDSLDVSSNAFLSALRCSGVGLDSFDLSRNPELSEFVCFDNPTSSFDFTANEILMLNRLYCDGGGLVGCRLINFYSKLAATPAPGNAFDGWYDPEGNLLSREAMFEPSGLGGNVIIAKFVPNTLALPGDVDGDGSVSSADAVLALRASMGLFTPSEQQLDLADLDGDGSVTASDAILILRRALGL